MHQFIIAAANEFTGNLARAGLKGPYRARLTDEDGAAFERAAGRSIPITEDANGTKTATVAMVTFVWGNDVIDGGEF